MLAAAALAVVPVADNDPSDSARAVISGDFGNREAAFSAENIFCLADFPSERVGRTREHVVAELVQVPAIRKPSACRRSRGRPTPATAPSTGFVRCGDSPAA